MHKRSDIIYNYVFLIGRLTHNLEVKTTKAGKQVCSMQISVKRPFKNSDGDYDYDFIKVSLWEGLVDIVSTRLKKGDKIGLKGRLVNKKLVLEGNISANYSEVIAERIVFLKDLPSPQESEEEV